MKTEKVIKITSTEHTLDELVTLIHLAESQGVKVSFVPFKANDGMMVRVNNEKRIGIRMGMNFNDYVYNLAHELAHHFLHYDKGDTIRSERHAEYEEQAERAANLLLAALAVK